ncbi:MAG: hypothetical protein FD123_3007 [Bacteroidetes bacterium]|nr:MAG: hypothetical protein FD123_3007 [Bacteroidota bacterium]
MEKKNYPFPDAELQSESPVTKAFRAAGVRFLHAAFDHVHTLKYRRNSGKDDCRLVLKEQCGTCSTKHALLIELVQENKIPGFQLMQCMFRLSDETVPGVGKILEPFGLNYIPEIHNYIAYNGEMVDITSPALRPVPAELQQHIKAVAPVSITKAKMKDHQEHLKKWREKSPDAKALPLETLWKIREACIVRLGELL